MSKTQELTYVTSDFLTASYLLAKDIELVGERLDGRRIEFMFHNPKEGWCEKLANGLLRSNDLISARKLHEAMKILKRIIHGS